MLFKSKKQRISPPRKYAETRWLSLEYSLYDIIFQWELLETFYKRRIVRKKEIKITSKQIKELEDLLSYFQNNTFKFYTSLLYWITTELNKRNVQFQSNKTRLHELFPKSLELLWVFANCILKNADLEQMKDDKSKLIDINFNNPGNSIFANENLSLENIQNNIDFSDVISETIFSVDLKIITNNNEHKILKRMCAKLSALVIQYLPVNNDIIKGFQTIDIRNRNMRNAVTLFRDFLLKTFVNAYQREDFQSILSLYQDIS